MHKKDYIFVGLSLIALVAMVLIQTMAPKSTDFTPDFSAERTIPYGCSALHENLDSFFGPEVTTSAKPVYNFYYDDYTDVCNYVIITNNFSPDNIEVETILKLVDKGCCFFISAINFGTGLLEPFHLNQNFNFQPNSLKATDTTITQLYANGTANRFVIPYSTNYIHFITDSAMADTLGINDYGYPDFIKVQYGSGFIFFNSQPFLFTNFHLLNDERYRYAELALSFLPEMPVVWDEYYKPNKNSINQSPVRFVLSQPALRIAWYLLLLTLFLYLFTGGRRLQRSIPIVTKPRNTSVEFIETLGRLYFNQTNHIDLITKKMTHWESFLRDHLFIDTNQPEHELHLSIAAKSGIALNDITTIYKTYFWIKTQSSISDVELKRFVNMINQFYTKCK